MQIGILADIHEHVQPLQRALQRFHEEGVEQVLTVGDIFETGEHVAETVHLLANANVRGVYGNHDLGLCHNPDPELTSQWPPEVVAFFASLQTRLELDNTLFCHGMPTWDPTDPAIYYLGGTPDDPPVLHDAFASSAHQIFFTGHFHRWFAATMTEPLPWDGTTILQFQPGVRYFVVIQGILNGCCAIFDSDKRELRPLDLLADT